MRVIFYLFLFSLLFSCSSQKITRPTAREDLLQKIIESSPTLYYDTRKIPKSVKAEYKRKFNNTLALTQIDSLYNKTDYFIPGEATGKILFLAKTSKNIGFLLYETGGISTQCHFLYYSIWRNKVEHMESLILRKQPQNFDELRQLIISKEFL